MKQERKTRTKEAVVHILKNYASPVALADLHLFIKRSLPDTAFSTIYRIVTKLETDGKLIRIDWRERGSHYEWAGLAHHHHIVCQTCSGVTDIDDALLNVDLEAVSKSTGFQIKHHSIELEGICAKCQLPASTD